MTQTEALKLALETLLHAYHEDEAHPKTLDAITAIKEALANVPASDTSEKRVDETAKNQHEQEPVAWLHTKIEGVADPHRPADLDKHPDRWEALYKTPPPCPTCEALARTVMLDQAYHDAQPEQDWRNAAIRVGEDLSSVGPDGYYDMTAQQWLDWAMEQQPRGKNSLAQREACAKCKEWEAVCDQHLRHMKKLKKQRTWVGLTDEERNDCLVDADPCECLATPEAEELMRCIEAKLKEKNT